jgi:hypothetical protein
VSVVFTEKGFAHNLERSDECSKNDLASEVSSIKIELSITKSTAHHELSKPLGIMALQLFQQELKTWAVWRLCTGNISSLTSETMTKESGLVF